MSRRTEIQVGITVLMALAILIGSLAWLKDYSISGGRRPWHITFPEAGGLAKSDEVLVNGIRKGDVKSLKLEGDHVVVELNLDKDITLTRDTRVSIRNVGLMGEKVIAVDLRTTGTPYAQTDIIPGIYEKGLGELLGTLGETVDAVARLSVQLDNVAQSLTSDGKLQNTLHNFNHTSEELRLTVSENRAMLKETLGNIAAASRTAKSLTTDRESELREALDHFGSAAEKMDRLSGRLDSLRSVIAELTNRVNSGEGTLGKLVKDDKLYAELNQSVQSLKALIQDIKANPKRYLKFSVF